jgi:hypothetical protein
MGNSSSKTKTDVVDHDINNVPTLKEPKSYDNDNYDHDFCDMNITCEAEFQQSFPNQSETLYGITDYLKQIEPIMAENGIDFAGVLQEHIKLHANPPANPESFSLCTASIMALKRTRLNRNAVSPESGTTNNRTESESSSSDDDPDYDEEYEEDDTDNEITSPASIQRTTAVDPRFVKYHLCTGESITDARLFEEYHNDLTYDEVANNLQVTNTVLNSWHAFIKILPNRTTCRETLPFFTMIWRDCYAKSRIPKALKIVAMDQLYKKYDDAYWNGQLSVPDTELIIGDRKLLTMGENYNKRQRTMY